MRGLLLGQMLLPRCSVFLVCLLLLVVIASPPVLCSYILGLKIRVISYIGVENKSNQVCKQLVIIIDAKHI